MRTIEDEGHSINQEKSVLEEVVEERSLLLSQFDNMIEHEDEFNIQFVTNPDDNYFIQFYDYLLKVEKKLSFMKSDEEKAEDATLERISRMIGRLETVALIEEKQRVRKMGPVRKLVYNIQKKRQK